MHYKIRSHEEWSLVSSSSKTDVSGQNAIFNLHLLRIAVLDVTKNGVAHGVQGTIFIALVSILPPHAHVFREVGHDFVKSDFIDNCVVHSCNFCVIYVWHGFEHFLEPSDRFVRRQLGIIAFFL